MLYEVITQKNEAKKQISLKINKIIPLFNPSTTSGVYSPERPSAEMSFHHLNDDIITKIKVT